MFEKAELNKPRFKAVLIVRGEKRELISERKRKI